MTESASDGLLLREYLASHDAFCPQCRYELQGLTDARCPECGRGLTLAEVSDPNNVPLSFAWWACYVPLVALGFIGVFGAYGLLGTVLSTSSRLWRSEPVGAVDLMVIIACAMSMGLVGLEHRWARDAHLFARWPAHRLCARAAAHWLCLLAMLAVVRAGAPLVPSVLDY